MNNRLKSKNISKWIICVFILLIFIGISNDICVKQDEFITFFELVLKELNSTFSLLFAMTFIIVLFSATNNKPIIQPSKASFTYLKQAVTSALLMALLLLTASFIYSLISRGFEEAFSNEWSYNSSFSMTGMSPVVCFGISVLLFGLRCVFLFYLISLINILTQKPFWGFWSVLIICFIDFRFYNQTQIPYPLNILPVEHTRLLYTKAFYEPMGSVTRGSYLISTLYWIVLIMLIYEIIGFIYKKRGGQYEKSISTRN